MADSSFPALVLDEWRATRDTVNGYAKLVGKIRAVLAPREKHWSHITLRVAAHGLTTPPILTGTFTVQLTLDFVHHRLLIDSSRGDRWSKPMRGQALQIWFSEIQQALSAMGIHADLDGDLFSATQAGEYDQRAVERMWRALVQIDAVFRRFKAGLRAETGPVHLFPHHFDLAMLWFSGNRVPDTDPDDEESADEQMNFGFSTGDEGIPEPYFYATAYPLPEGLLETALPADASWRSDGFSGAVMPYAVLLRDGDPQQKLYHFLVSAQQAGARLMRN